MKTMQIIGLMMVVAFCLGATKAEKLAQKERIAYALKTAKCPKCYPTEPKLKLESIVVATNVFIAGTNSPTGQMEKYNLKCAKGHLFRVWENPEAATLRQPVGRVSVPSPVPLIR